VEVSFAPIMRRVGANNLKRAAFALDVTDLDQLTTVVHKAEQALGQVNILVNNAGIPDAKRAHKMPLDLINKVFDTNLRSPYILSCEVARRLIDTNKPGRIVNIASMATFNYHGEGAALYCVTKAGGWNAGANGRHHEGIPAPSNWGSGADGQYAFVFRLTSFGFCHWRCCENR
jgi:NADP-dependent 3-hydroxy acid dehydrogenase YdfG